jgi:hypothetical protein
MLITIVKAGLYSVFGPFKIGATMRQPGEVVNYPDWYGQALVTTGQAKAGIVALNAAPPAPEPAPPAPPAPEAPKPARRRSRPKKRG